MTAQHLLGINLQPRNPTLAQPGQRVNVALRFVSEMEVVAFVYLARV